MPVPILATKLYRPPPRPNVVARPRLLERLNEGLRQNQSLRFERKLTLISAPAGFGKTTLVSEWINGGAHPITWLSLDKDDNDPARFLAYLIATLQRVNANLGAGLVEVLQTPQPPPIEALLTALVNEISALSVSFVLILDDYHVIEAKPVNRALAFLLEHLPPQMHLVIATREDPDLPLARLRARGQLTELRAADLRFTLAEAAEFLNALMGLSLTAENIAALEARTEGWIAGLQLAALAVQGTPATPGQPAMGAPAVSSFIQSFTGSHHFVMDYLVEEVLHQQSAEIQTFLLRTSILERLCGPLCEAVCACDTDGHKTLEYLQRANLFIIPLDNERRWYRYHHLFADLLRQRLKQLASTLSSPPPPPSPPASGGEGGGGAGESITELHLRASQWYEDQGLMLEAFHHAAAANDIVRAERLVEGKGIPLHLSGAVTPILDWLASLPPAVMNARPALWWRHASLLLVNGQTIGVAEKLQAAETALQGVALDDKTRNLIGQIATATATLALTRYDGATMLAQSRRALEHLLPTAPFTRATAHWTLGSGLLMLGDRAAARAALTEAITLSRTLKAPFTLILATISLGNALEVDTELYQAAETYRQVVQWAADRPQQIIHEAHLGLARILYEWNDLEAAQRHGEQGLHLARQYESVIDRFVVCEIFLARLKLAQGDMVGATTLLTQAEQSARQLNFKHRLPEIAAVQVLALLKQNQITAAAQLAAAYPLPFTQARVHLAQGNAPAALAVLAPVRQQAEAKDWKDEQLKAMVLQAVAHQANGAKDPALQTLGAALALAEPGGFVRLFVDAGPPMAQLLAEMAAQGIRPSYVAKLQAAFPSAAPPDADKSSPPAPQPLIEPLSQRELEILQLIAQGLSNQEISERLFLALSTVKGHTRNIFGKLQVQRRTEAVARARELGLL